MARISAVDRVKIWNSFFSLARRDAKSVFELRHKCKTAGGFNPLGGTLGEEPTAVLGALLFCALAVEARANHLIEKLFEEGKLTRKEAEAASFLSPDRKWFLLPRLAGRRRSLRADVYPHKAIVEICSLRNALVHVQSDRLSAQLPQPDTLLMLFEHFVAAMDDLNGVLGKSRGARKRVRDMGRFRCA
jgi:hypothetical protein